ncbi:MAG: hypothetical protein HC862_21425 [Scytonema sp. RU_4_4]|nr:hypothetical protein [Scytonema sp. RU_4_4]NJR72987.1 hypothetical protein [Scytonema sp. CRU_2_7]
MSRFLLRREEGCCSFSSEEFCSNGGVEVGGCGVTCSEFDSVGVLGISRLPLIPVSVVVCGAASGVVDMARLLLRPEVSSSLETASRFLCSASRCCF